MQEKSMIGQRVGNYHILSALANEVLSSVYLAYPIVLPQQRVVVKMLSVIDKSSSERYVQFMQEIRLHEQLQHRFILPYIASGAEQGYPYFVTAYASAGTLRERMTTLAPALLPLSEVRTLLTQVGEAITYMHQQGVVHGDLKPANILFNAQGEALLADFGLAAMETQRQARQSVITGSFHYMAPEQCEGVLSRQSDQYALGCMTYELVTGRVPFVAMGLREIMRKHCIEEPLPPSRLNAEIPRQVEQAILQAMAKRPADRHQDVASFVAAFNAGTEVSHLLGPSYPMDESNPIVMA